MTTAYTITQKERLMELSAEFEEEQIFENEKERDKTFREIEKKYVALNKNKLKNLLNEKHEVETLLVSKRLESWLQGEGFTQVSTPTIISKDQLNRMTITEDHHLHNQVFWIDKKKCLRPMLAPNLYVMMREMKRVSSEPVKIFEIGPCFRKESQGALHMNEFTMLNLVELATLKEGEQMDHLEKLAKKAMEIVGIENYTLEKEGSTVYGETLDIVVDGIEIASASYGPHPLDNNWGVFDVWAGIGIGIDRIALVKGKYKTIKKVGKSIAFVDGVPLNI